MKRKNVEVKERRKCPCSDRLRIQCITPRHCLCIDGASLPPCVVYASQPSPRHIQTLPEKPFLRAVSSLQETPCRKMIVVS